MATDLFASVQEATCACLVISGTSPELIAESGYNYPLLIIAAGLATAIVCSIVSSFIITASTKEKVSLALNIQLILHTILMIPMIYLCSKKFLPAESFTLTGAHIKISNMDCFRCTVMGSCLGQLFGMYANHATKAAAETLANKCIPGSVTSILSGLAFG